MRGLIRGLRPRLNTRTRFIGHEGVGAHHQCSCRNPHGSRHQPNVLRRPTAPRSPRTGTATVAPCAEQRRVIVVAHAPGQDQPIAGGASCWYTIRSSRSAARTACSTCLRMAAVYTMMVAPGGAGAGGAPVRTVGGQRTALICDVGHHLSRLGEQPDGKGAAAARARHRGVRMRSGCPMVPA